MCVCKLRSQKCICFNAGMKSVARTVPYAYVNSNKRAYVLDPCIFKAAIKTTDFLYVLGSELDFSSSKALSY